MKKISAAAVTKTGRRRNNQDNFLLNGKFAPADHDVMSVKYETNTKKPILAAVCDGMGGEASGERASFVACEELAKASAALTADAGTNKRTVKSAILHANKRLCDIMQEEQAGRMGSTVIAVLLYDDTLFYTNLGDSRIYLLRDGKLIQITKDHTEGRSMVEAGVLTEEQLKTHPSRNKLNRHLGIFPEEMQLECAVYEDASLRAGDKILLVSDGVFGAVEETVMKRILAEKTSAEERAAKLVDTAFESGSKDNMTAMVMDVEQAKKPLLPFLIAGACLAAAALGVFGIVKAVQAIRDKAEEREASADPAGTELWTEPAQTETEDVSGTPSLEPSDTEADSTEDVFTEPVTETAGPDAAETDGPSGKEEVVFASASFEQAFREAYGLEGAITADILEDFTELVMTSGELTDISDAAMFPNLKKLDLSYNNIADISALSGLTSLTELRLGCNLIADVSPLGGLTSLTELDLGNNLITDVSLLCGLSELRSLTLSGNTITGENIDRLREALPECILIF